MPTRYLAVGHSRVDTGRGDALHADRQGVSGFYLAVGNYIPHNTPVENALYYQEAYEEMSKR